MPRRFVVLAVTWCIGVLVFSQEAFAHRVNVFAYEENGKIVTESFSSSGKKCKGGKVSVYDGGGALLLEGTTDDNGMCSFDVPGKRPLRIVLDAGQGHRAEYTLPGEGVSSAEPKERGATPKSEGIRVRDVIGGLGWIVGIMGIAMYFRSRKHAAK